MKKMTSIMAAALIATVVIIPNSSFAQDPDVSSMTSQQRKAYFKEQIALKRIQQAHAAANAIAALPTQSAITPLKPVGSNSALNRGNEGGGDSALLLEQKQDPKFSIYGRVLQTLPDGILVQCQGSGRIGLKQAKGTVMVRGEFATEGGFYRSTTAEENGFFDYTTVLGAAKRVQAYKVTK